MPSHVDRVMNGHAYGVQSRVGRNGHIGRVNAHFYSPDSTAVVGESTDQTVAFIHCIVIDFHHSSGQMNCNNSIYA